MHHYRRPHEERCASASCPRGRTVPPLWRARKRTRGPGSHESHSEISGYVPPIRPSTVHSSVHSALCFHRTPIPWRSETGGASPRQHPISSAHACALVPSVKENDMTHLCRGGRTIPSQDDSARYHPERVKYPRDPAQYAEDDVDQQVLACLFCRNTARGGSMMAMMMLTTLLSIACLTGCWFSYSTGPLCGCAPMQQDHGRWHRFPIILATTPSHQRCDVRPRSI